MNCSLCGPCFPCGFMKCLKQENKKVNTSVLSMLESCMFHILQYQDFLFGTCFFFLHFQKEKCRILFSSQLQNQRISEKMWSFLVKEG